MLSQGFNTVCYIVFVPKFIKRNNGKFSFITNLGYYYRLLYVEYLLL